jgi:hypothetical protein
MSQNRKKNKHKIALKDISTGQPQTKSQTNRDLIHSRILWRGRWEAEMMFRWIVDRIIIKLPKIGNNLQKTEMHKTKQSKAEKDKQNKNKANPK